MKKRIGLICLLIFVMLASTAFAACEREEDHRYGPWKTKTSATCTRQGHQFKYCSKCDHWEQRWTSKLPHTPGEMTVTKEPTCTTTGKQSAVCQVCNNTVYYTIDKLGHDWGEITPVKAPTCKAGGTGNQACTRCTRTRSVKMDKVEHTVEEWNVTREPAGKRKGMRTGTCTMCNRTFEEYFHYDGVLYEDMDACPEVIAMQEKLRDLGYYKGAIRSGQFGSLTTKAVTNFQKAQGLPANGVADLQTLDALDKAWEKKTGKSADTLAPELMESAEDAQAMAG